MNNVISILAALVIFVIEMREREKRCVAIVNNVGSSKRT